MIFDVIRGMIWNRAKGASRIYARIKLRCFLLLTKKRDPPKTLVCCGSCGGTMSCEGYLKWIRFSISYPLSVVIDVG